MSNDSQCMVITLDSYKYQLEDPNEPSGYAEYHGKMEVSYDGQFLGVDTWEAPINQDLDTKGIASSITLCGPDQANLLVGAILALLEAYNEPTLFNDEDIEAEYQQMAEKTKDSYAEETTPGLED